MSLPYNSDFALKSHYPSELRRLTSATRCGAYLPCPSFETSSMSPDCPE